MCLTGIQAGKRIYCGDLALKFKVKRRNKEIMKELFNDEREWWWWWGGGVQMKDSSVVCRLKATKYY